LTAAAQPAGIEVRVEVRPPWPFRLGGGSADGLTRRRGHALQRLLRVDGRPVLVGVVQPAADRVLFAARADTPEAAHQGIARMRFATAVDDDLRPFYGRFADDPVIGRAVRLRPELRVRRKPSPWEALVAAITEQLIEFERAVVIQRRLNAAYGFRCPATRMRDATTPAAIAREAPARLCAFDLAPRRALALRRCAEAVAAGRIDLADRDVRRLLAIRNVGPWTVEMLPRSFADEAEVRGFFARYGEWKGLAGEYLRAAAASGLTPAPMSPGRLPRPAGTRWSAAGDRRAAA
jgi:3-methyladenine DNA glycosylase/8-oxoguanine DNA glycosylase